MPRSKSGGLTDQRGKEGGIEDAGRGRVFGACLYAQGINYSKAKGEEKDQKTVLPDSPSAGHYFY